MQRARRGFIAGLGAFGACAALSGCRRPGPCASAAPGRAGEQLHADATDPSPEHDLRFAELAGFCAGAQPIAKHEYEGRIERVRAKLAEADQSALIVEAGVDMRYF